MRLPAFLFAILALGAMLLIACAQLQPRDGFCVVAAPIKLSSKDKITPETEQAIQHHNGAGERLCGWRNR